MNRDRDTRPEKMASAPIGEQADHVVDQQLSGREERLKRIRERCKTQLRVIPPLQLPPDWEIRSIKSPGAPRTRADCANVPRPCPYLDCTRGHLWVSLEDEQAGNPQAGKRGEARFKPSTMETCARDVAERGPSSFEYIGKVFGMDPTRGRQIAKAALKKLALAHPELAEQLEAHL